VTSKKENVTEDKELSKIKIYLKQYNIFILFIFVQWKWNDHSCRK